MRNVLITVGVAGGIGWLLEQLWVIARGLWWRIEDWVAELEPAEPERVLPGNDGTWWLDILDPDR